MPKRPGEPSNPNFNPSGERPEKKSRFLLIDFTATQQDQDLKLFLQEARVSVSKKGDGVFISGRYGADSTKLSRYGIPVKGAMIVPFNGDPQSEVERIEAVVQELKQEVYREEQRQNELRRAQAEQEKQAIEKAEFEAKEKLLAEYQKACENFPELGLKVEDGQYHQEIVNAEGRPVWGINYTIEGYLKQKGKGVDEFRKAANLEIQIRDFRDKNLQRVIGLNTLAVNNNAGKITPLNWEGWEAGPYAQDQSSYYTLSHSLYFDKTYQWTESDIDDLEKKVKETTTEIDFKYQQAFEELKKKKIAGAAIKVEWSNIEIDGEKINFPTAENAKIALAWALENGAYLPHHHALGEQFRDRAKSENWDEQKSRLALLVLKGEIPLKRSYSFSYIKGANDWSGAGQRATASAEGWFMGNVDPQGLLQHHGEGFYKHYAHDAKKQLNDNELRFVLKFINDINQNTAGTKQTALDFSNATKEDLEIFAKQLKHERELSEKRKGMEN